MAESRVCTQCGESRELTSENWHKSKDGFHAKCRSCRNKEDKRGRDKKRDKKLSEIEKGAVDLFIAQARVGGANIPHSSELLEILMRYFGGAEGFGRAFIKQFYDAPAGGAFRTKQLDSVMRLIVSNTAMGGSKKPLDLMTDEELEAELRRDVLAAAMAEMRRIGGSNAVPAVQVLPAQPGEGRPGGVPSLPAGAEPGT